MELQDAESRLFKQVEVGGWDVLVEVFSDNSMVVEVRRDEDTVMYTELVPCEKLSD